MLFIKADFRAIYYSIILRQVSFSFWPKNSKIFYNWKWKLAHFSTTIPKIRMKFVQEVVQKAILLNSSNAFPMGGPMTICFSWKPDFVSRQNYLLSQFWSDRDAVKCILKLNNVATNYLFLFSKSQQRLSVRGHCMSKSQQKFFSRPLADEL